MIQNIKRFGVGTLHAHRGVGLAVAGMLAIAGAAVAQPYTATTLVYNICCGASHSDPRLAWAWGVSMPPSGPAWVVNNGSGSSTRYDGSGNPFAFFIHTVRPDDFTFSSPAGIAFNGTPDFIVPDGAGGSAPAAFLFSTREGTITGWTPGANPPFPFALIAVDNSRHGAPTEASYDGLAIVSTAAGSRLYAADFHNRRVDAFDGAFGAVAAPFTDPALPAGFAPFNIASLNGAVLVAYAVADADGFDPVPGAGRGIVDVFDSSGGLSKRLITGGALNVPYGMAIAPHNFGAFSDALLVANFGDGLINAYNADSGAFLGTIRDSAGVPIFLEGVHGIAFGNGDLGQPTNTLFYATTPAFGIQGIYGRIEIAQSCYANCDQSSAAPVLNANDFQCFLNRFAAGDPSANCDGSTSFPSLNANDFQCFLNAFAAGCS